MSQDHQVHIANNTNRPLNVIVSPNEAWVWADVTTGVASLAFGGYGIINSVKALYAVLRTVSFIGTGIGLATKTIEFFKKNSIEIAPGEYRRVNDKTLLNPLDYLGPSGWGEIFGASTLTVMIVDLGNKRAVKFNSNADDSWIVNENEVVRAERGRIWVEDRNSGYYRISVSDRLLATQSLLPGQCLSSPNGDYDFIYQPDGNAVVYKRNRPAGEKAVWSSKTKDKSVGKISMQEDGNFVICGANNKPVAAIDIYGNTDEYKGRKLIMQDDGNLVVYDKNEKAVWDTMYIEKPFNVYP